MPRQTIDKDRLVDAAYAIAEAEGLSALSIRKLASACQISVGSVYTYFPTKTDLTTAVIERFFGRAVFDEFCRVREGERFIDYLRRLKAAMDEAMGEYESRWLVEIHALPAAEREAGRAAGLARFAHMECGLALVLDADPTIPDGVLAGALAPERLAALVTERLLTSLRERTDLDTLFALLDRALAPRD